MAIGLSSSAGWLRRFFWFATGANYKFLSDPACPESERMKFSSIGAAMCITTALAFVSGWMVFYEVFFPGLNELSFTGTPWRSAISLVFASVWTVIIFNMQRFVMFGSRRDSDQATIRLHDIFHALPGMILCAFIGLTVATPLQVLVLKPEIESQLLLDRQSELDKAFGAIERRLQIEAMDLYQREIELEKGGGAVNFGRQDLLPSSSEERNCAEILESGPDRSTDISALRDISRCLDIVGQRVNEFRLKIAELRNVNGTTMSATTALSILRLESQWLSAREQEEKLLVVKSVDQGAGLLRRVSLAYKVDPNFSWVLLLTVIFIQTIPVLIRTMSPKGPYDDLVEIENREVLSLYGIEFGALTVTDRNGKTFAVDSFAMVKEVENSAFENLLAERLSLRKERQKWFSERYSELMNRYR